MSDDDAIVRKLQMRATTSQSPGYCVRQSEETMRRLANENFNLKLKIYFLENKHGESTKFPVEISNVCEKEYFDLVIENEALKTELNEKKNLMMNALQAIELLEKQKDEQRKESEVLIDDYTKRIEALKVRSKMHKRKMEKTKKQPQAIDAPNTLRLQEELSSFKAQNVEIFARINDAKRENLSKSAMIEKLSEEKLKLLDKCERTERAINEKNNIIASLSEKLSQESNECDLTNLTEENKSLKAHIEELSRKYAKLERECRDYERIVNEQSEIMKALNRTIEAKNDELNDYKTKIEFSSTNFIQDNEIKLNGTVEDNKNCKFPFHNPLFGSFQSLYR